MNSVLLSSDERTQFIQFARVYTRAYFENSKTMLRRLGDKLSEPDVDLRPVCGAIVNVVSNLTHRARKYEKTLDSNYQNLRERIIFR